MTAEEREEYQYRYIERLGLLCGADEPTDQEKAMAKADADAWLKQNYVSWLGPHAVLFDPVQNAAAKKRFK